MKLHNCIRDGFRCKYRKRLDANGHDTKSNLCCCYLLDTGLKRNSPAGAECDKFIPGKCLKKERKEKDEKSKNND